MKFIAKTLEGLESVLADELRQIGAVDVELLKRAVSYTGDQRLLYLSNIMLRSSIKVLVFMKEFSVANENDLYLEVKKIPWEEYFDLNDTFAIDSVVNSTKFRHANYIALKAKDAIADRFREKYGSRPNVQTNDPDFKINVHIREDIVTLSIDSSGNSLHMRGYRKAQVDAPLSEVLAAGLVLLSDWDRKSPLIDPMCGSGTILSEAALIAGNIPPQRATRNFAFKKWKSFDNELYEMVWAEVNSQINKNLIPSLVGSDKLISAVNAAQTNINEAGLSDFIKLYEDDFFYHEGTDNTTLIFNPPYDGRLKEDEILGFYKNIGDKLKLSFQDCTAWILSGHIEAIKNLGLRPSRKISLINGSIESLYCRYDMYKGSKKQKWKEQNEGVDFQNQAL